MKRKRMGIPPIMSNAIYERDNFKCVYCGNPASHLDHVIPHSKGGEDSPENLVASCKRCNTMAHDKSFNSFEEKKTWLQKRILLSEKARQDTANLSVQPLYKNYKSSLNSIVKTAGVELRKIDFHLPGETFLAPYQEHLTALRKLDLTWREIAALPEYHALSIPAICRIYKRVEPGNKVRKQLGIPTLAHVQPIGGVYIPDGTQVIRAERCECGQWYISNHPRRKRCFMCRPYKARKDAR